MSYNKLFLLYVINLLKSFKIMKKIILFGLVLIVINSCQKEEYSAESEQLDINEISFRGAIFANWEEFYEKHSHLENQEDESSVLFEIRNERYIPFLEIAVNSEDDE